MRAKFAVRRLDVEVPVGPTRQSGLDRKACVKALGNDHLGRPNALQRRGQPHRSDFADAELAARQVDPRQTNELPRRVDRQQQRVALLVEQRRVGQRTGSDDARHGALYRSLAGRRVADLLADHHRLAQPDQFRQVLLDRVVRHPGHPDRLPGRLAARRQGDAKQPRRLFRIVEKQLVEVTHPVEQQQAGMLFLDPQVLLHHRGVRGFRTVSCVFIFRHIAYKPWKYCVKFMTLRIAQGPLKLVDTHRHVAS
ncbi:MAG: hypothetical protein AW12_02465 [Candidatus Accumulibacter sp. BA-94]|nr:MAG: hypothetical protein AW12_02465 [Candidatus Accumulibacter sp. BA-94]